jgi:hypothetical protein
VIFFSKYESPSKGEYIAYGTSINTCAPDINFIKMAIICSVLPSIKGGPLRIKVYMFAIVNISENYVVVFRGDEYLCSRT